MGCLLRFVLVSCFTSLLFFPGYSFGFSVPAQEEKGKLEGLVLKDESATKRQIIFADSNEATVRNIESQTEIPLIADQPISTVNRIEGCNPNIATFDSCHRNVIPEDDIYSQNKSDQESAVDPTVIRLAEEANLTIGDSLANHKIVFGRASCKCGVSTRRIVGGSPSSIRDLPWTVALTRGSSWGGSGRAFCGGTLINSRYVLTASHCVDGQTASAIQVLINEQDMTQSGEAATERYSVSSIIMHSGYNRRNIDNDIALLKLSRPVALIANGPIVPACLPASNSNSFAGVTATVAGWGATSQGSSVSSVLRKVEVPVISNRDCNTQTKYPNKITDNMLCAGFLESGGRDSCQGDSGGPLIINNGGRKTLIGIVSWGYGCAQPKAPGVYTRVSKYPDWILANTRDADWCEG
ncbi:unnamed protein product [Allacma fusca]|uniref:Peptidase S1 domain-containing protein n=1 Tax=Allacma fusca TaxID=39272 RepID=A0A8J2JCA3_9HEXA|nr:unnamed protein product [Allacma fusca]